KGRLGKIETFDLGKFRCRAQSVVALCPESQAESRSGASRASGALVGGGAADLFDEKRVNAAVRIVAGHAGKAGIHAHCHSINREGGFSHVSRNDDLAFSDSRDSLVLVRGWEFAVKRKDKTSAWRAIAHFTDGALDLVRTGHENENISIGAVKILRNRVSGKFPWGIVARL